MRKIFFIPIAALMLASCQATFQGHYTARSIPIAREAIPHSPLVADLKVDPTNRISFTTSIKMTMPDINFMKEITLYRAMKETGSDVIVDPIFEIVKKGGKYESSVSGYKGTYTNIRTATKEDIENLKNYNSTSVLLPQVETDRSFSVFSKKRK
jgi:hypothetical protein